MAAPSLIGEHGLNPLRGWFDENCLDFYAKLSSNVTVDIYPGRVAHLNSSGEYELGVSGTQMAIFLFSGSTDFDVARENLSAGGYFVSQPVTPSGNMVGFVASGGFELETSEFDTSRTYAPNDLLTADANNTSATLGGVLDNKNSGGTTLTVPWAGGGTTNAICGVVSGAKYNNEFGVPVLPFWTVYLPGTT